MKNLPASRDFFFVMKREQGANAKAITLLPDFHLTFQGREGGRWGDPVACSAFAGIFYLK